MAVTSMANTSSIKSGVVAGKVLQVVRATDSTYRTTTSTSFVDASISVTITPHESTSSIMLIWLSRASPTGGSFSSLFLSITDASNNAISGAEESAVGNSSTITVSLPAIVIAYDSPATLSAVTYKGRFKSNTGVTSRLFNADLTAQMFAIEVAG